MLQISSLQIVVYAGTLALSCLLVLLLIRLGHQFKVLDIPNPRSNHVKPIPRMGGVAVVLAFFTGLLLLVLRQELKTIWFLPVLIGAVPIAILGLLDDIRSRSSIVRLAAQLTIAIVTYGSMTEWFNTSLDVTFLPNQLASWFEIIFAVLFITWMVNLYNFMDGIDGIAGSQALLVAVISAIFCIWHDNWQLFSIYILVALSISGFLIFNWSPAKIFLGDCGSYFLGFIFAALALMNQIYNGESLVAQMILLGAFIVDATFTLFSRLLQKKKVGQAHKDHGYQHLVTRGRTHSQTTLIFSAITLFWLAPLSAASMVYRDWDLVILLISYLPIVLLLFWLKAGVELRSA